MTTPVSGRRAAVRTAILDALPSRVRRGLRHVKGWAGVVRVQAPVTRALGPQFQRSRRRIEIDITWACNLRCFNCNRSCEQAPTGEGMTLDQIVRFVDDSLARPIVWERIRVLGGEPTLHPQLDQILAELLRYRRQGAPQVRIELVSNGYGERVRRALARVPDGIIVENTAKESASQPFASFNVAPVDRPAYRRADFTNGCWVTEGCGVGLTPYGYYPCAVAGGIDRIVGLGLARRQLPDNDDDMFDQLDAFCRLCGSFKRELEAPVDRPVQSETWERAYARHQEGGTKPPARY